MQPSFTTKTLSFLRSLKRHNDRDWFRARKDDYERHVHAPMVAVIEWLTEGHRRLRDHVAALDDSDLIAPRWPPEGDPRETRWIVANMVRHDDYHAGEINHLRALIQGDDEWEWESG